VNKSHKPFMILSLVRSHPQCHYKDAGLEATGTQKQQFTHPILNTFHLSNILVSYISKKHYEVLFRFIVFY
jgi:hypothetical protein